MDNFNCPSCGMEFEYSEELAGRKCECPVCGVKFIAPPSAITETPIHPHTETPKKRISKSAAKARPGARRDRAEASGAARRQSQPTRKKSGAGVTAAFILLAVAIGGVGTVFILKRSNARTPSAAEAAAPGNASRLNTEPSADTPASPPTHPRPMPPPTPSTYNGFDTTGIERIARKMEKGSEPWLQAANARIDKYRKADLTVKVLDSKGRPVPNATVSVELVKHKFHFGGIISAGGFRPHEALYKKTFLAMGFNAAGFCNSLKYKLRKGAQRYRTGEIVEWLRSKKIYVRGHCLIWPGAKHLPPEIVKLLKKRNGGEAAKNELRKACDSMIEKWAAKWDVDEWDVINEPRGNHGVQDILGYDVESHWFDVARRSVRNGERVRLCFNDNRVISDFRRGGGGKKKTQTWESVLTNNVKSYRKTLERLLANNAPIDFLGFQTRFAHKVPPEIIYKRLQVFDKYNLPIVGTEFEIRNTVGTELEKAEMEATAMIVYFSHRLVDGIYAWSLFPTNDGREILNKDGTPNLRGKAWLYLTKNRWTTREILATGSDGTAATRAFKGEYTIKVETQGGGKTERAKLDEDLTVTVRL